MKEFEDYYRTLGIPPDAGDIEIYKAYEHKVKMLRADLSRDAARHVVYFAEKEIEKVRIAYHVLSDRGRRKRYDRQRSRKMAGKGGAEAASAFPRPEPRVDTAVIRFDNVEPYVTQSGSFTVSNTGGPYNHVSVVEPPQWVRIVETRPVSSRGELPMQVLFEAIGLRWGTIHTGDIVVAMDDEEARVTVKLRTKKRPAPGEDAEAAPPPPPPAPPRAKAPVGGHKAPSRRRPAAGRSGKKPSPWLILFIALLTLIIIGASGYAIFHYTSSGTSTEATPTSISTPTAAPQDLYNAGKDEIQLALDIYLDEHGGHLPVISGTVTLADAGGTFPILNMCILASPQEALRDVPDSCIDIYGIVNDNCDGGICKCNLVGHYIWLADASGNVLSTCVGDDCDANNEDGYQGVWP